MKRPTTTTCKLYYNFQISECSTVVTLYQTFKPGALKPRRVELPRTAPPHGLHFCSLTIQVFGRHDEGPLEERQVQAHHGAVFRQQTREHDVTSTPSQLHQNIKVAPQERRSRRTWDVAVSTELQKASRV